MNQKLDEFYNEIKKECWKMIKEKKIDLEELSFAMGISKETLLKYFDENNKDLSVYLRTYNLVMEWK